MNGPPPDSRAYPGSRSGDPAAGPASREADLGALVRVLDGRRVVDLHGSLATVRCLDCGRRVRREAVQRRLLAMNPGWEDRVPGGRHPPRAAREDPIGAFANDRMAPDGDAEVPEGAARGFRVPPCRLCGGVLKPDVDFFGENVPPGRTEEAWRLFHEGGALLVAGSSLAVHSGLRFVRKARETGIPVAIVNLGPTRGDEMAAVRVEGRTGEVLPRLPGLLTPRRALRPRGRRAGPPRR